jgi:hypothetical protein
MRWRFRRKALNRQDAKHAKHGRKSLAALSGFPLADVRERESRQAPALPFSSRLSVCLAAWRFNRRSWRQP